MGTGFSGKLTARYTVANNGLEALEKIRKVASLKSKREGQPFDCILMDLEMPG
jgi:CheY-like chemotaxis protein